MKVNTVLKNGLLLFAGLMLSLISVQAQGPGQSGERDGQGRRGRMMDPQVMAERQTERMTEELELTDQQVEQVQAINLKYAEQQSELFASMRGEGRQQMDEDARMEMRDQMMDLRIAKDKELKTVLTKDQFKAWKKMQKQRQEQRGQRGGQGGPGGQGGRPEGPPPGGGR